MVFKFQVRDMLCIAFTRSASVTGSASDRFAGFVVFFIDGHLEQDGGSELANVSA